MDDEMAARAGIPLVDVSALSRADAAEFKDQVQGAFLHRIHAKGKYSHVTRIELREEHDSTGTVAAWFYGDSDRGPRPVGHVEGRTPKELADAVHSWEP